MTVVPPVRPMLAEAAEEIPSGMLYEPKWDGWRCLCFVHGGVVRLYSRRGTELTGDFPEIVAACAAQLPEDCVVDGEIVLFVDGRLEYSQLARRHGAGRQAARLARELPTHYVVFDLLSLGDRDCRPAPQDLRRELLADLLADVAAPLVLTPCTRDRATAVHWFDTLEAYGLDGVVAKPPGSPYQEGVRVMSKIKHRRTADVVVGGYRWDRNATPARPTLGSLLLGAFDGSGPGAPLHFLGVCSGFPHDSRVGLGRMLGELETPAGSPDHPWGPAAPATTRLPDSAVGWGRHQERSRLIAPLLVCEVTFDSLHPDPTGVRFRSNAAFLRWRTDKDPDECLLDTLLREVPTAGTGLQDWLGGRPVASVDRTEGPTP